MSATRSGDMIDIGRGPPSYLVETTSQLDGGGRRSVKLHMVLTSQRVRGYVSRELVTSD
jgi:hypothetical protein